MLPLILLPLLHSLPSALASNTLPTHRIPPSTSNGILRAQEIPRRTLLLDSVLGPALLRRSRSSAGVGAEAAVQVAAAAHPAVDFCRAAERDSGVGLREGGRWVSPGSVSGEGGERGVRVVRRSCILCARMRERGWWVWLVDRRGVC